MLQTIGNEDKLTVCLCGEIDHHTAKDMREEIEEMIHTQTPKILTLDFAGVTFMDSSGIGLVMGRYQSMQAIGGRLTMCNAPSQIAKIMRLAGLDKLVRIEK